jgi:hypothetical protein
MPLVIKPATTISEAYAALRPDGKGSDKVNLGGNMLRASHAPARTSPEQRRQLREGLIEMVANEIASNGQWSGVRRQDVVALASTAVMHVCNDEQISLAQVSRLSNVAQRVALDEKGDFTRTAGSDAQTASQLLAQRLSEPAYLQKIERPQPQPSAPAGLLSCPCDRAKSVLYAAGQHVVNRVWQMVPRPGEFYNNTIALNTLKTAYKRQAALNPAEPRTLSAKYVTRTLQAVLTAKVDELLPQDLAAIRHSVRFSNSCAKAAVDLAQWAMDNLHEDFTALKWTAIALLLADVPDQVSRHLYYEPHEIAKLSEAQHGLMVLLGTPGVPDLPLLSEDKRASSIARLDRFPSGLAQAGRAALTLMSRNGEKAALESSAISHTELLQKFDVLCDKLRANAAHYEQFKASPFAGDPELEGKPLDEVMELYDDHLEESQQAQGHEHKSTATATPAKTMTPTTDTRSDTDSGIKLGGGSTTAGPTQLPGRADDKSPTSPGVAETPHMTPRFAEPEGTRRSGKPEHRQRKDRKARQDERAMQRETRVASQSESSSRTRAGLPPTSVQSNLTGRVKRTTDHHDSARHKWLDRERRDLYGRPGKAWRHKLAIDSLRSRSA